MKRIAIIISMVLLFNVIQNSYGQDTLKATHQDFSTELNVNLFQGQLSLNNSLNEIKVRYFYSNSMALRIGFIVQSKNAVNNEDETYGINPTEDNEKGNSSMIGLNFGIEKHFNGTRRLSPYIGAEATIGYKWSKYTIESTDLTTTIDGGWPQIEYIQNVNGIYTTYSTDILSYNTERGYFSYGLNFVTGFDFYVAKHLFVGYELEFGFTNKKYTDINITYSGTDSSSQSPSPTYKNSEFSFGPNIINGIRLGYIF